MPSSRRPPRSLPAIRRPARRTFPPVVRSAQHRVPAMRARAAAPAATPKRSAARSATRARAEGDSVVLSPALGGIVIGHEVAGRSACGRSSPNARTARSRCGAGFSSAPADRVLVVEDVVTTGLSTRETMEVARAAGAEVVGGGARRSHRWRRRSACRSGAARGSDRSSPPRAHLCARRASRSSSRDRGPLRNRSRRSPVTAAPSDPCAPSSCPSPTTAPSSSAGSDSRPASRSRACSRTRSRGFEGRPVTVVGAGRTDAGVHAAGQVASARVALTVDGATLRRALNAAADAVRVLDVEDRPEDSMRASARKARPTGYRICERAA